MDESIQSESGFLCVDEKMNTDSLIMDGTSGDDECTESRRSPGQSREPSSGGRDRLTLCDQIKDFDNTDKGKGKRQRHRRGKTKKRRQWKPYNKLTWKERGELEDFETKRANRTRAERFAHGQPVAPYNTTQFLMEDHDVKEPNLDSNRRQHRDGSVDSSDEYYSSPEDEMSFLQKEFSEEYERSRAERLHSMSKAELVAEYVVMESRMEEMGKMCADYSKEIELRSADKCDNQTGTDDLLPTADYQSKTCSNYSKQIELRLADKCDGQTGTEDLLPIANYQSKMYSNHSKQIELRSADKCDRQTGTEDLSPPVDYQSELLTLRLLVENLQAENELLRSNKRTVSLLKSSPVLEGLGET